MPPTATATPLSGAVTVPGTAELEFDAGGTGQRRLDVVVIYSVMDNAAVRITQGASHMRAIGPKSTTVRQTLGFGTTDKPTPGAFRVKATVMEDGKAWAECTWNLKVHSGATEQVMKAMANVAPDAPYVEIPDDAEIAALAERADRSASRKRAVTKKAGAKKAAAKKSTAKKTTAKKSAGKKTAAKKSTAKKGAAKKAGAKKTTAKKAGAKKSGAKKIATKKRPDAKKKSAAKKRR